MKRRPSYQGELAGLRNCWPVAEDGIILAFDGVQDFLSTTAEQFNIDGEIAAYLIDERQPALEPFPGTLDFKAHHFDELSGIVFMGDVGFSDTVIAKIFQRQIDSAFFVVGADVLPEICELKSGAGEIGKALPFIITISPKIEHKMADGVGGVAAVPEQIIEGLVTSDPLVLAECRQQIGEGLFRNIELAHRSCESNEDGMPG